MKNILVLGGLFIVLLFSEPPMFDDFIYIQAGGVPITVAGGHADPCVVDWDYDGLKDLMLGEFTLGRIRMYPNIGTNDAPLFSTWYYLEADGQVIQLPYG